MGSKVGVNTSPTLPLPQPESEAPGSCPWPSSLSAGEQLGWESCPSLEILVYFMALYYFPLLPLLVTSVLLTWAESKCTLLRKRSIQSFVEN